MLATLYNIPRDLNGLNQMGFVNADLHTRINLAIQQQTGRALPYYVLDPIPPDGDSLQAWLQRHQDIHNQMDAILGIAGNDISDVDFSKPDQVASWIWLHAQEHFQANLKLGIG